MAIAGISANRLELLQIADAVAREKSIPREIVLQSMEDALQKAARSLEIGRDTSTVHVRPEQVVEIALDGVQTSTRYPGGVALRFARVKRYRDEFRASGGGKRADPR